jgi:SAM-dependent methyltransferase
MSAGLEVIWHDVECAGYEEDLSLWHELAGRAGGPVLDVGAGTGRVALELARTGVPVVGLDADPALCDALRERADGLPVEVVCADAREFEIGRRFALIVVPMQTVQLLGGATGRAAFLRRALAHLEPGGLLAVAIADPLDSFDADFDGLPRPDEAEHDGTRYTSQALAVADEGEQAAIHRVRQITRADGSFEESDNVIRLDRVEPERLEAEAAAAGLRVHPPRLIPATDEYIGSTVVVVSAP